MPFILYANPVDYPELWDHVFVGGIESPGICEVETAGLKYGLDKKKGKGTQKRTVTFTGAEAVDCKIKFKLWLPEHFDAWAQYQNLFEHDPTRKKQKAIDVGHPKLAFLGVHNFITENIGPISHEGNGLFTVTVELAEFCPPPKVNATSTPNSVDHNGDGKNGKVTAQSQQDKDIAALLEQASRP